MTLLISGQRIAELLTPAVAIDAMAEAILAISRGSGWMPVRTIGELNDGKRFGSMPAASDSPATLGAKLLSFFPGNAAAGLATTHGLMAVFSPVDGTVSAILEGGAITALRTAAASGLATRSLARPDARTLGIFGTGSLVVPHVAAIRNVRTIKEISIWGRSDEAALRIAAELAASTGLPVRAASAEDTAQADIICTLTSARTPVLEGAWLRPGCHVNLVGSSSPACREIDTTGIVQSRLFVDARDSALEEAGDVLIPIAEGALTAEDIVGELGHVIDGHVMGRTGSSDITVYKSVGHVMQDLLIANAICEFAQSINDMPHFDFSVG